MRVLPAALSAQIGAELRMRMRSFATPLALLAFLAGSLLWIPNPNGNSATLSWELADGRIQSPVYTAGYLGLAVAVLSCIFLTLGGFYLVAGTVRRDRQSGVGAILAATPLSKSAYLGGKFAAHLVYLLVVATLALAAGVVAFIRFGTGPFDPVAFLGPYAVMVLPAITTVAALAVLFDVTPGLRSRGGLVIWFFVFAFVLVKLPMDLGGDNVGRPGSRLTVFDPAGVATDQWLVRRSVPEDVKGISTGHVTHQKPIERVPWPGLDITPRILGLRAFNVALAAIPLALAVLLFDRFRGRVRLRGRVRSSFSTLRRKAAADPKTEDLTPVAVMPVALAPVAAEPSAGRAILAEARLVWEGASWIKWPLAASAILSGLLPGNLAQGLFLLLLVPLISEAAAREDLHGTGPLVFSQPGLPRSVVLWKAAALSLVVLMLGFPMTVRAFGISPARGLACVAGLLAVAGAATGFGYLTRGGKLFTGLYVVAWYVALSGLAAADFTGMLSKGPAAMVSAAYLGGALALITIAAAVGTRRASA